MVTAKGWLRQMSSKQKLIFGLILIVSVALVAWQNNYSAARVYLISDVLFLLSIGLLIAAIVGIVSNSGLFDIVVFSSRKLASIFIEKQPQSAAENQIFADYIKRKRKKHDVRILLLSGCFCLIISLLAASVSM